MRHVFIAALIGSCAVVGSAAIQGQSAKGFTCAADNGGLTLPAGFCSGVVADGLGAARNLVVAPNGDLFVTLRNGPRVEGQPPSNGYIVGLRDTNGDGRMDVQE